MSTITTSCVQDIRLLILEAVHAFFIRVSLCIYQIWDLRFATAPVRILEHHKRGVLSIAWCPQDSDLLLSAAKDNQVLCWNPNSEQPGGEVSVVYYHMYMYVTSVILRNIPL